MTIASPVYEVETRFNFQSQDELWDILPFFRPHITQEVRWNTIHYGLDLFRTDRILRINHIFRSGKSSSLFGWKEPDQGKFANIRLEYEEDITEGIDNSIILAHLGCKKRLDTPAAVANELIRLGHLQFMAFSGKNLTGEYEPQGFQLKLMLASNPVLRYPLLLEVEKTAHSPEKASEYEAEIFEFIGRYRLDDRVVREEPPALLNQVSHKMDLV